jgi:hypothetical protein
MRAILALGLLITLCASADAAPAHHRRHVVANPTQVFTPGVRSGFAYAPDGPVIHDQFESTRPSIYDNKYQGWGG